MCKDDIDRKFDDGESIIEFLDLKNAKRPSQKGEGSETADEEEG